MEPLTIKNNLEHWEIPTSDVYPQPNVTVPVQASVNGTTVTLNFGNLPQNCRFVVVVTPALQGVDGSPADFQAYYFTSQYQPYYASYQSVLSEVQVLAHLFTPHMIYQAIRDAGTRADMLTMLGGQGPGVSPSTYTARPLPYPEEVIQYTKYGAAYMLTLQVSMYKEFMSGEEQELNDFRVRYGQNTLKNMLSYLEQQMEYWRIAMVGWARSRWVVKHGMLVPTGLPMPGWVRKQLGRGEATGIEGAAVGNFGGSSW